MPSLISRGAMAARGYGFGVSSSASYPSLAVSHIGSPFITVYPWNNGFGSKLSDPSTLPTGNGYGVTFNTAQNTIAIAHDVTPFLSVYPWTRSLGFGSKYADPASPPTSQTNTVVFNAADSYIGVPFFDSAKNEVAIYPFIVGTGFGTRVSAPTTLPSNNNARGLAFSPNSYSVAIAVSGAPYLDVYDFSSGFFGARYSNPTTIPTGIGRKVLFPTNSALLIGHDTTPFIDAYNWGGFSGFSTRYNNAATLPTGSVYGIAFNSTNIAVSLGLVLPSNSIPVYSYVWSSSTGFGTKYNDPVTLPLDNAKATAFNSTSTLLAVAHDALNKITVYPWTNAAGYGTAYAAPSTLPTGGGTGVAFTNFP